jgi:hypothetical protein
MKNRLVLVLISLFVFGLVLNATNSSAGSDPKFTLLVSQSLVENGNIRLDAYQDDLILNESMQSHVSTGVIVEQDGHLYNYFPVGPSILSLPVVSMAHVAGMDMRLVVDNFLLQKVLAGFASVLMVWIIYSIGRCFLDETSSIVIAAVSILGTGLISSMGTALWTVNFSTVFIGLSVLLLARFESGKTPTAHPVVLGILLFLAFFSRASSATFIIAALGYLLLKERRQFLLTAATSLLFLLIFLTWSRLEFGTWLPIYYSKARLQAEREPLWIGLLGNLVSPSRGIFIFSPFFLLLVPGAYLVGRFLTRQLLAWMALSWFLISLLLTARAASWWGGESYGPRIMTESLLALILLVILIWNEVRLRLGATAKRLALATFALLSLVAIFINTYQGLFNPDTVGWNQFIEPVAMPPITGLGDVFHFRYPQFLATNSRNCEFSYHRYQEVLPYDTTLSGYRWGDLIRYTADQPLDFRKATIVEAEARLTPITSPAPAPKSPSHVPRVFMPSITKPSNRSILIGWLPYKSHLDFRRSICPEAHFVFRLDQVEANGPFELALLAGAMGEQEVRVSINGTMVGAFVNSSPVEQPDRFIVPFDGALLKPGDLNEITLELPDASRPRPGSWQYVALAFYQAAVYPTDQTPYWVNAPLPTPSPLGYP